MYFFKSRTPSNDPVALHMFLDKKKNVQAWWQDIRDKNTLSFLYSQQTRQLDASIARLSELINNYQAERAKERSKALHKLFMHVQNWQHMHAIKHRRSQRETQVQVLADWLKQQLELASPLDREDDYQDALEPINVYAGVEIADQNLYQWWRSMSDLGWFSRRSSATKELDSAIEWFSQSIIIDRHQGLQELMAAIEVWKDERQGISRRLPMVESLQQHIRAEIADLSLKEKRQQTYDGQGFSLSVRGLALFMSCYLQEIFEAFDGIFEMSSLLVG